MGKEPKTKKNLYMERRAADLLQGFDNASDYVSNLIIRHERERLGAWRHLTDLAWTRSEISAAVNVLVEGWLVNDLWWNNHPRVRDALDRGVGVAARAGIEPGRWSSLAAEATTWTTADALLVLAREVALGNERARSRLESRVRVKWSTNSDGEAVDVTIDPDVSSRDALLERLRVLPGDLVLRSHGPYEGADGSVFISLTLAKGGASEAGALAVVRALLEVEQVGWFASEGR